MSAHSLHAFTDSRLVGKLTHDSQEGRYSFEYSDAWKAARDSFYLSPAIPLYAAPERQGAVHRFFENLLPEGRALDIVSIVNQVSKGNTFALINVLDREPVGAFGFIAFDASEEEAERLMREQQLRPERRRLPDEELSQRIRERDAILSSVTQ